MHSLETAREAMLTGLEPMAAESVLLAQSAGRVLAADVAAAVNLPRFDNSAMDGYAVIAAEAGTGAQLKCVGEVPAGLNERTIAFAMFTAASGFDLGDEVRSRLGARSPGGGGAAQLERLDELRSVWVEMMEDVGRGLCIYAPLEINCSGINCSGLSIIS